MNCLQFCRWTVFNSVGELSSILSVNCLQNACRWTVLSANCLDSFEMTPPPPQKKKKKYPQSLHTPINNHFFLKAPQKYWNSKLWTPKMARAYACMKISEYPPPPTHTHIPGPHLQSPRPPRVKTIGPLCKISWLKTRCNNLICHRADSRF